eukprot:510441_1
MEAILDKKSPKKKTARWQPRLFRLKDRRLIHFKKGVVDSHTALDSSAKYTLDLTHLTHLVIDKKTKNILIIYHPVIDLALRFKTNEQLVCWLNIIFTSTFLSFQWISYLHINFQNYSLQLFLLQIVYIN